MDQKMFGAIFAIGFLCWLMYIWGEEDGGGWSFKRFFKTIYELVEMLVFFTIYVVGATLVTLGVPFLIVIFAKDAGLIGDFTENGLTWGAILIFALLYQIPWYKKSIKWFFSKLESMPSKFFRS